MDWVWLTWPDFSRSETSGQTLPSADDRCRARLLSADGHEQQQAAECSVRVGAHRAASRRELRLSWSDSTPAGECAIILPSGNVTE